MQGKQYPPISNNLSQKIDELQVARLPVLIWLLLVYMAAMILQNLVDPTFAGSLIFSFLFAGHSFVHWHSFRFAASGSWLYFLVQAILILLCAIFLSSGYPAVLNGLLPILIGQSLAFYYKKRHVLLVILICLLIFFWAVYFLAGFHIFTILIPLFTLTVILVTAYAILFFQQVRARLRTQSFLRDLESAHKKVEELTLANERQRMARDLHDTLAQGVAGLIMQLEAVDAFLAQDRISRAQDIVQHAMLQARRTLADARQAIDNLRLQAASEVDFTEALHDEVRRFIRATGMSVTLDVSITRCLSSKLVEHSLRIISECLTNTARHAKADQIWITIANDGNELGIEIRDNGEGFNTELIGKQTGHYGLLGIQERVRLIGGQISIASGAEGTSIRIKSPIVEGEQL